MVNTPLTTIQCVHIGQVHLPVSNDMLGLLALNLLYFWCSKYFHICCFIKAKFYPFAAILTIFSS